MHKIVLLPDQVQAHRRRKAIYYGLQRLGKSKRRVSLWRRVLSWLLA